MSASSRMKYHAPFIALFLVLAVYLGMKTLPEEGWSGWGEPSAQTLLTLEHWANEGIIHHKFLYIPIGYSKSIKYLDDPELRHHARGTVTGSLIGRRLYYTHYPSGFVLPYAFLRKAGVTERHAFRLLSLAFSFGGLILLYVFMNRVTTPLVAFFAVLYYGASTMFLDFADTLNNQPIDDLLRFAILAVSLGSVTGDKEKRGRFVFITWVLFLVLAISSYDSTFFIYAWLVGIDLAAWLGGDRSEGPFRIKKWAFYASAPVIDFSVQMFQNWWYLGTGDMILDIKGTLDTRLGAGHGGGFGAGVYRHLTAILVPFKLMTGLDALPAAGLTAAASGAFLYLRSRLQYRWPRFTVFLLLLIAGSVFTFIFAKSDDLNYQGRQLAPALGLIVGSATAMIARFFHSPGEFIKKCKAGAVVLLVSSASVMVLWYAQIDRTVSYVRDWPNNAVPKPVLSAYKAFKSFSDKDGFIFYIDMNKEMDYPQPRPTFEYYSGKPVLFFKYPDDALRDLIALKKKSEFPFDAVISSPQPEAIEPFLPYSEGGFKVVDGTYYTVLIPGS